MLFEDTPTSTDKGAATGLPSRSARSLCSSWR